MFAHRRVALAGGGGSGGRCGWKLHSREAGSALAHAGMGDGHAGRGGFPHELNLRRGQGVGLVCEVAEGALQGQGFGGAGAGGCAEKLKLGKQKAEIARRRARRSAAPACLPIFLFLAPFFLTPLVCAFRFPPSGFSFLHSAQVSESSLATARSLLLGFSIAYFRPRMFPPSIHPLGFLLSAFYFQLSSPTCAGSAAGET